MDSLTKKDLIDAVAAELKLDRDLVRPVLQEFLQQLTERLGEGRRVEFRDFGVFEVRQRAARSAQNPRTLQRVAVPARRTVKFKPGRLMKLQLEGLGPQTGPETGPQTGPEKVKRIGLGTGPGTGSSQGTGPTSNGPQNGPSRAPPPPPDQHRKSA